MPLLLLLSSPCPFLLSVGQQLSTATSSQMPVTSQAALFTTAEVRKFQHWMEEGYDLPDPRYLLWLETVGGTRPDSVKSSAQCPAVPNKEPKSSCQDGECGHPKARQWIGCDHCPRWYHCICVAVTHKKAHSVTFTCSFCLDK